MKGYSEQVGQLSFALINAILEMSDHAESLGGASSIAGIAALHKLQSSIQKNRPRILKAIEDALEKDKELPL